MTSDQPKSRFALAGWKAYVILALLPVLMVIIVQIAPTSLANDRLKEIVWFALIASILMLILAIMSWKSGVPSGKSVRDTIRELGDRSE